MQTLQNTLRPRPLLIATALALLGLHLLTANRYGIFRDELYYIACARHLAWGYVDHPPAIATITWLVLHTLGTSLLALRVLPALASLALVLLTASLAQAFGGGRRAQALAGLSVCPVPIYLLLDHWLTMNAFEPLLWTALAWILTRLITTQNGRWWLLAGALAGLGLELKYTIAVPLAGLAAGILLTPERRWFATKWPWLAGLLALLLFLPNLVWLTQHNFPFIEFEHHSRLSGSRILRGPIAFIADQALMMNPLLVPLGAAGLAWLFLHPRFRALGIAFACTFATFLLLQSKNYYLAQAYPIVFAAGAVALETLTASHWRRVTPIYATLLLASGLVLLPLVSPVLPIAGFLRYQHLLGGLTPIRFERLQPAVLPQYFADEFGWQDMARATAQAYQAVPANLRPQTTIFGNDYGQAAAIDFFGPALGLPQAVSGAESYWLWGPHNAGGASVLVLGSDGTGDARHFKSVQVMAQANTPLARSDEHFPILWCQSLTTAPTITALWPDLKRW